VFPFLIFPTNRRDWKLKEDNGMQQKKNSKYFINLNREEDIDERTFEIWKSELQKELPSFWDSMQKF